jgi:hypothetical protein
MEGSDLLLGTTPAYRMFQPSITLTLHMYAVGTGFRSRPVQQISTLMDYTTLFIHSSQILWQTDIITNYKAEI